jgi:hypothetical protein
MENIKVQVGDVYMYEAKARTVIAISGNRISSLYETGEHTGIHLDDNLDCFQSLFDQGIYVKVR